MKKSMMFVVIAAMMVIALPALADAGPDGAALFKGKCASCHGADGSGQTAIGKSLKLRDLRSEEVQKQTAKELFTTIADGKGKMPPYKAKLATADIDALVAYVKSLKK